VVDRAAIGAAVHSAQPRTTTQETAKSDVPLFTHLTPIRARKIPDPDPAFRHIRIPVYQDLDNTRLSVVMHGRSRSAFAFEGVSRSKLLDNARRWL